MRWRFRLLLASEDGLDLWDDEEEDWNEDAEEEGAQATRLVTDPREVERLAEEREDENWAFRDWIKLEFDFDDERLMSVVRELSAPPASAASATPSSAPSSSTSSRR